MNGISLHPSLKQISLAPENVINNLWVVIVTPPSLINMLLILAMNLTYWLAKFEFWFARLNMIAYSKTF